MKYMYRKLTLLNLLSNIFILCILIKSEYLSRLMNYPALVYVNIILWQLDIFVKIIEIVLQIIAK